MANPHGAVGVPPAGWHIELVFIVTFQVTESKAFADKGIKA